MMLQGAVVDSMARQVPLAAAYHPGTHPDMFWPVAVAVLVFAVAVVRSANIFHAGLALAMTFGGVAALYAMLGAHFIAAVQVLIYVGAIAVILSFAVMLTQHIDHREASIPLAKRLWALLACGVFALCGIALVNRASWSTSSDFVYVTTRDIGKLFLSRNGYLLQFEMAGILLLMALVAAVMVASQGSNEGRR